MLLQSPKSARSSLWSWEELGAGETSLSVEGRTRVAFRGGPRGVCAVASGLLLSVICGLHRGPWGGRLGFPWVPRGSGVCLGSWGGRCALGTSLFSGCHGRGRGPFRQRGRAPDTPTRLRAAASLKWQEWIFQDTCHMLRGPRQEKFP